MPSGQDTMCVGSNRMQLPNVWVYCYHATIEAADHRSLVNPSNRQPSPITTTHPCHPFAIFEYKGAALSAFNKLLCHHLGTGAAKHPPPSDSIPGIMLWKSFLNTLHPFPLTLSKRGGRLGGQGQVRLLTAGPSGRGKGLLNELTNIA